MRKHQGFGAVEILIAMTAVTILVAGIAAIGYYQYTLAREISQRGESSDLNLLLRRTLSDSTKCDCNLRDKEFQIAPPNGQKPSVELRQIRYDCTPYSQTLARTGQHLSSGLRIERMALVDLAPVSTAAGQYAGFLEIKFASNYDQIHVPPLRVHQSVATEKTANVGVVRIAGCAGDNPGLSVIFDSGWVSFDQNPLILRSREMELMSAKSVSVLVKTADNGGDAPLGADDILMLPASSPATSKQGQLDKTSQKAGWSTVVGINRVTLTVLPDEKGAFPQIMGTRGPMELKPHGAFVRIVVY